MGVSMNKWLGGLIDSEQMDEQVDEWRDTCVNLQIDGWG